MTTSDRSRPTDRTRGDEGLAFLVVVVVIALVMAVLTATLFRVALDNISTSSRMVGQNQALQAAEAGIDAAYAQIESVTLGSTTAAKHSLPCGPMTGELGSSPARSSSSGYSVTVTYYKYTTATHPTPANLSPANCATTSPLHIVQVLLTSSGTDSGQTATVTSQAHIAPVKVFDNSIFVNGLLTLSGSNLSNSGNPVLVRTGQLTCQGGGSAYSSVLVFGTVTAVGHCTINGALEATKSILVTGASATIGGTVISTTSSITATTAAKTISGNLYAKSTITVKTPAQFMYTISATDSALVPPTKPPWPNLTWKTVNWATLKYKTETPTTCQQAVTDIKLANNAATSGYVGIAVQIPATCPKITIKSLGLNLAQSLAIVTTKGINFETNASISNSPSTHHTLFLIVPTRSTLSTCSPTNGDITIHGSVATGISTLIYTPCAVTIQGTSTFPSGVIYAKSLTLHGNLTIGPATFTLSGVSSTQISVGIVYERELS
jgi:hypothetical protein